MKRLLFFVTALAALSDGSMSAQTQKAEILARVQALCEGGEFERVFAALEQISRESPALAADALVERAKCSVVRGQQTARSSYESAIRNYADDPAAVADARSGISNLPVPSGRPAIFTVDIDPKAGLVRGPVTPLGPTAGTIQQFPTWSPDDRSIAYHAGPMGQGAVIVRSLATGVEKVYDARRTDRGGPALWLNSGEGLLWISSRPNGSSSVGRVPGITQPYGITLAESLIDSLTMTAARGNSSGLLDALESEGAKTNRTALAVASQKSVTELRDLQGRSNGPRGAAQTPPSGNPGDVYRIDTEPPQNLMNLSLGAAGTLLDGFFTVSPRDRRLYSMDAITSSGVAVISLRVYDLTTGKQVSFFPLRTDVFPLTHGFPRGGQFIAISPDGERLAFTLRPTETDASILICSAKGDGKDCRIVLPNAGPLLGVAWAPDGRSIFYAKSLYGVGAEVETNRIMHVSVDGGSPISSGLEVRGMTYFDLNHAGTRLAFDGVSYTVSGTGAPAGKGESR